MKKELALLSLMAVMLVSCGNTSSSSNSQSSSTPQPASSSATSSQSSDTSSESVQSSKSEENEMNIKLEVNGSILYATLEDNTSAEAFYQLLPVTIEMHDYANFEKVGPLGTSIVRNDEYITTEPGDIILYQGNQITVYYDTNSWNFTRLGKIENATKDGLLSVLGEGDVTITFSAN